MTAYRAIKMAVVVDYAKKVACASVCTQWSRTDEMMAMAPVRHSDYRDHRPIQLREVYELYSDVVKEGMWTMGLLEMWCVVGRKGLVLGVPDSSPRGLRVYPDPHTTPPHNAKVLEEQGRQVVGAHPLLGLFQVEPLPLAWRLLRKVRSVQGAPAAEGAVLYAAL